MANPIDLLDNLSEKKRALIALKLRRKSVEARTNGKIIRRRDAAIAPLSFSQRGIWFLWQWEPDSPFYNIPVTIRLKGHLDVDAVGKALTEIVRRHAVLRATFPFQDGEPVQIIAPARPVRVPVTDLTELDRAEREQRARQLINQEIKRPFNLIEGPTHRVELLKLGPRDHILLLTLHHIVFDGWSVGVLAHEAMTLYQAYVEGRESPLAEPPIQYADYAIWEREWLQGDVLDERLAYWKELLGGQPPIIELPTDKPRPAVRRFQGRIESFELSESMSAEVKEFARKEGVTLFMILLYAFQVLLHKYTAQEDIVVGTPNANRNHRALEVLIGYFVSTLVIRMRIDPERNSHELLDRLRDVAMDACAHSDLPFERVVKAVKQGRDPNRNPLFQVMFVFQNAPSSSLSLPGLTWEPLKEELHTAKFDLTLGMLEIDNKIAGSIEYDTDLLDEGKIKIFIQHFEAVLRGVLAHPEMPIRSLEILTETERRQLLVDWNTTSNYYKGDCLHHKFEEQARRSPDATALIFGDQVMTYGELDRRANHLAGFLTSCGQGPDKIVAIYADRSVEMVVAVMGVLKSGSAYLPVDPAYPKERVAYMLRDAGVDVVLTHAKDAGWLESERVRVVSIAEQCEGVEQSGGGAVGGVGAVAGEKNLAYVIYTSGSTGRPKGVMVTHANAVRLFDATHPWYSFSEDDTWSLFHSIAFDLSVWEIFGALSYGARLVIVPYWVSRTPEAFYDLLRDERVTILSQTPSAFRLLIRADQSNHNSKNLSLRLVVFGGEALELQSLRPWFDRHGDRVPTLVNMYGITETIVHVTYRVITSKDLDDNLGSVVGVPIPDLQVYILDKDQRLVPPLVVGEMYVGGDGVARGYLGRPDLTAERFIPHPFSTTPGAVLYRSGDLARYLPDGDIEYIGRIDHQVKIRGFRVETGEIEAMLNTYPGVAESAVLVQESATGSKVLVAYLVAKQGQEITAGRLRKFLEEKLPVYMVPSSIMILDRLPLTLNGKLDRRALLLHSAPVREAGESFRAPRNPVEQTLAQIWAEVLGVKQVSIEDNFFELGGDSILSIQITAKANQAGFKITPKQIFEHQTVASLAEAASLLKAAAEQEVVVGPVPLTPIQHQFLNGGRLNPDHFNQAILFESRRPLDEDRLKRALSQLIEHHDALRLRFTRDDGGWRQVNAGPGDPPPFTLIDMVGLSEPDQTNAIESEAARLQASLNLADGPILQVALFKLGPRKPDRLLFIVHHLAIDGVSWRILLDDLQTCYDQLEGGQIMLPAKTTSYKDWAVGLEEYAQSPELLKEAGYWLADGRDQVRSLPVDYPDEANTWESASAVSPSLDAAETQALLHDVAKTHNAGINEILLAALASTLAGWVGGDSLLIDMEGHGREEILPNADVSRTVGWFTTIFPVYVSIEGASEPIEVLESIKEQLRRIPNRGIGYGVLRHLSKDAQIIERLRAMPRAQILFNYLGQLDTVLGEESALAPGKESVGPLCDTRETRGHLLEINSCVVNGQVQINWVYSRNMHRSSTIENLARAYAQELRSLIAQCRLAGGRPSAHADFPEAGLNRSQIDRLMREIGESRRDDIEDVFLPSHTQQGILFHCIAAPETETYFIQLSYIIRGDLDLPALKLAWQRVVDRQQTFRSSFFWRWEHHPVELVYRKAALPFEQMDWRGLTAAEQRERLASFLESDRRRGFDLSQAPLMRITLIQLEDEACYFVWSHHHLLLDGWSVFLVLKEVFACYEAFRKGEETALEPPRRYGDYITWLRKQNLSDAERFWRRTLKGFTTPTRLKIDKSTGNDRHMNYEGEKQHVQLPDGATAKLQHMAQTNRLTLNTLVQGAWALLMSHYSGLSDVAYGAVVSGRPAELEGVDSMVGLFINTLPVRVRIDTEAPLVKWLAGLQGQLVEMRQYEHSPLIDVHRWSDLPPGLSLFDTNVSFDNYPVDASIRERVEGIEIDSVEWVDWNNYPLSLAAGLGSELWMLIKYDRNRFDSSDIQQMASHLQALMLDFVARPNARPSDLIEALSEADRRQRHSKQRAFKQHSREKLKRMKSKHSSKATGE